MTNEEMKAAGARLKKARELLGMKLYNVAIYSALGPGDVGRYMAAETGDMFLLDAGAGS